MSEGLYKKSVGDSIDPHLPGANSRAAEKAAAAEDARARLREGEDVAAGNSGTSSDDASGIENGGFYVSGGAVALRPRGFSRRGLFGKGKKTKNGKRSGFRRYGPMFALFGMIFGAGGVIGAVQGLMPFHVVEQVTEMFDGSFTSRANRLPRMMKNIADMDGKTGKVTAEFVSPNYKKYRRGLKKYKSRLAKQGINMVKENGKTVLKWQNHLGEDIVVDAKNFSKMYETNTDFRNDFSRGTRGFMGRIAAWIDLSAAKFFSSHNLTKNLWKDWQQETFRKEGKETKFKDIIRGRKPDANVEVEEGHVKTYPETDEDGNIIGWHHDEVEQTRAKSKTKTDFVDRLSGVASGISNFNCMAAAVMTTAVGLGYSMIKDNAENAWQAVAEGVDKTKAGDGANAPIYDIGNYLSNKLTASSMITIMSGGKIAPAQDSSLSKLNLNSIYSSIGVGAGVAVTCAIAKVAIATVSIVTTILTGGLSGTIGKLAVGVGKSIALGTAANLVISKITDMFLDSITTDLCLDTVDEKEKDDPTKENDDAGNCLAVGGLSALQTNFRGGGGTLGATDKVSDFYDAYQLALKEEAEYDRATKSPFDATNGNTFLGSMVSNLVLPVAQLSSSPAGFISSIGGLLKSSISSLLPSASAISKTEYLASQIGDCPLAESIGAVGNSIDCSPIIISDMSTMNTDPDEVLTKVVKMGKESKARNLVVNDIQEDFYEENFEMNGNEIALDENGIEKIKKGSHLDKYIRYCSYRESPFGVVDQNIISTETTASSKLGNETIDSAIDNFWGSIPIVGDVIDIWNANDEMLALQWATGANCVARDGDQESIYASSEGAGSEKVLGKARPGSDGNSGESVSYQWYKTDKKLDKCYMEGDTDEAKTTCEGYEVEIKDVEYDTLSWDEVKWYQRYVEDDRLVEMVDGEHSAVQNLLASYEEENPIDNSTAGILARKSGMLKEDVEVALNEIAYWEYLADYEPSDLYPTPVKHTDAMAGLKKTGDDTVELPDMPEAAVSARVWYAPLRDKYSATA